MYKKDRLRRSMMFVPGNNPGMIRDAHIYGADSIMFDLEDSVAYINWKQNFYDEALSGKRPYVSNLIRTED